MNVQETRGLLTIARTHQPYRVPDIRADPAWVGFPETRWQRSYIGAPIRLKGKVVGFLNFDSATPDFFTAEQARRAQIFADQVALAMQNAQSYAAIQRHVRRLTLLHQVSVEMALAQTAPQLHQQIVRAARQLVERGCGRFVVVRSVRISDHHGRSKVCRRPCWAAPCDRARHQRSGCAAAPAAAHQRLR